MQESDQVLQNKLVNQAYPDYVVHGAKLNRNEEGAEVKVDDPQRHRDIGRFFASYVFPYDTPSSRDDEEHREKDGLKERFERDKTHYQVPVQSFPSLLIVTKANVSCDNQCVQSLKYGQSQKKFLKIVSFAFLVPQGP